MSGCRYLLNWNPRKKCVSIDIPADINDWLFDPSSLTARLIKKCSGRFRVEVLSIEKTTPTPDEIRVLKMRYRSQAIIRQVLLYCDDKPWVYARTIIPVSSLRGPLRGIAKLGNKPLGAVLFADKSMVRSEIEVACVKPDSACYVWTHHKGDEVVWGRRSVFWVRKKPLLVSEFFLPELLK